MAGVPLELSGESFRIGYIKDMFNSFWHFNEQLKNQVAWLTHNNYETKVNF